MKHLASIIMSVFIERIQSLKSGSINDFQTSSVVYHRHQSLLKQKCGQAECYYALDWNCLFKVSVCHRHDNKVNNGNAVCLQQMGREGWMMCFMCLIASLPCCLNEIHWFLIWKETQLNFVKLSEAFFGLSLHLMWVSLELWFPVFSVYK